MNEQESIKRRKCDNGLRRFFNPGWVIIILLVAGFIFTFVSNVRTIPAIEKRSQKNEKRIDKIEWKLDDILEKVKEIKEILKR